MIDLLETERIKSEIEENPSKVMESIESTSSIGICITNSLGLFVEVNTAYTKIYGYNKSQLLGKSFLMVVPEENKANMEILHKKFLKDKREIAREWEVVGENGKRISISVDAGYSEDIFDKTPHKITFIEKQEL